VLGPTWPNRMYWHSGTSNGLQGNDRPPGGFTWPTIHHRLIEKGIEYRYYYGNVAVLAVIPDIPTLEYNFWMEDFFHDAAMGKLKPVTYIDPGFLMNDDHPPIHTMLGQQLIASVYTALANSPQWKNTLLVITYDEHGGYYDHVAPPSDAADDFASTGFNQLGVRVPALVIGPYAKASSVVSTRYDHTSALKHIQNMFGTAPLTARVDAATDLTDCIDAERLAAGDWAEPVEIPAVEVNESDITDACSGGSLRETHSILEWVDRYPEYGWSERRGAALRDYVFTIGDVLERYNAGRIIRGK